MENETNGNGYCSLIMRLIRCLSAFPLVASKDILDPLPMEKCKLDSVFMADDNHIHSSHPDIAHRVTCIVNLYDLRRFINEREKIRDMISSGKIIVWPGYTKEEYIDYLMKKKK